MRRLVSISLFCFLFAAIAVHVHADGEKKVTIDHDRIYFGSPSSYKKPAVVNASAVFKEIPAYKQILKEKLTEKDPKYMILIAEANQVFKKALKKVYKDSGYDLIGEVGAIKIDGKDAPDVTSEAINAIE